MPGAEWVARREAELAVHAGCAHHARARTVFGVYDGGTYGAVERVADHLPVPPPHQPRQRLWRIVAKRARARGRRHRAADRVRRQRPARRHDWLGRPHLCQPLRRRCRAGGSRCSPTTTTAGAPQSISPPPASTSRPWSIRAPDVRRCLGALGADADRRARLCRRDVVGARAAARASRDRCRQGGAPDDRLRPARDVGRLESRRRISPRHHGAQAGWNDDARSVRAGRDCRDGMSVAGAASGALYACRCLARRRARPARWRRTDRASTPRPIRCRRRRRASRRRARSGM